MYNSYLRSLIKNWKNYDDNFWNYYAVFLETKKSFYNWKNEAAGESFII